MKFKSNIESQAGIEDSASSAGTAGQILSSLGPVAGVDGVGWIDQAEIVAAGATRVLIACKNTSGGTITKGTPVYQTGNVGATDVIEVAAADALISTGYLPAIGLLETDLINNAFGHVVITGELLNITTSPIDGVVPTTGDTIYLKSGGGLTLTKPTGEGNAIQNLGLVGKVSSGNAGSLTVASIMRQNDVPNLPTGKIWVGDGNTIVSDVVYLDETNGRMGIKTTSPGATLEVQGYSFTGAALKVTDSGDSFFEVVPDGNTTFKLGDIDTVGDEVVIVGSYSDLKFNASGNTTMTLDNNNRVGIGTTSPGYKLDVAGDAYIDETLNIETTISGTLQYGYSGVGAGNLVVGGLNFASFTPAVITLMNQDTTISAGQDLGVLQFGGKDDVTNGYANGQIICTTAGTAGTGNTGGGIFRFLLSGNTTGSAPTERMRITNTGNVGIGTTSPQEKVHVSGSSNIRLEVEATDSTVAALKLTNTAGSYASFVNASGSLSTYDYNAASTRTTLLANGNLGIGTTTPGEKLEVNGSVKATASTDAYKGYIKQSIICIASEKQDGTDYFFIPYNTSTTSASAQYYNRMVAAYDGRVKKVYIKNTAGTPSADTVNFKKHVNDTTDATAYSATVANAASAGMSAVYNFADSDFTFNEGDNFGVLYQTINSGGGGRSMASVTVNIIVEYNIT